MNANFSKVQSAVKYLLASLLLTTTHPVKALDDLEAPEKNEKKSSSNVQLKYEKRVADLRKNPPPTGSVICIGSSQMEFWKTVSDDLTPLSVYNHGIGGSRMSHAAGLFISNLAIPFKPRAVILYEGSNDLAAGEAPEKILEHFQSLHAKLHAALPETRLYVLGIVPSPGKRFEKFDEVLRTNALLKKECDLQPWMKFIDTTSPLIGADGVPRKECFIPENIHMTPAGYEVWKAAIGPVVVPAEVRFEK